MAFIAQSSFQFTGLTIIDALRPDDLQTGLSLRDEVIDLRRADGTRAVRYKKVKGRAEFFAALHEVHFMAFEGYRPLIHVEAHGNETEGLNVGGDEFVSWLEFGEAMYRINVVCQNNLAVVLAACYGLYAIDVVDIERPCPYTFLIAAPTQVCAGLIQDRMGSFYKSLIDTLHLATALKVLGEEFLAFRCDIFFYETFVRVYRARSMGKGADEHVEELVTRAIKEFNPNKQRLTEMRKTLKDNNRRPIKTYERMGSNFLHGKPLVPFDDMVAYVRENADRIPISLD